MPASIQKPLRSSAQVCRAAHALAQTAAQGGRVSVQRQSRQHVLDQPLAGRQAGLGELADDLDGRRDQLGAAGRRHRAARRFAIALEALARGGLLSRSTGALGASAARGGAALGRLRRSWRAVALGLRPGRSLRRHLRGRRARRFDAATLRAHGLARVGGLEPDPAASRADPAASRAAVRRALERCGRVRGRFVRTPPSPLALCASCPLVFASATCTSLLKGRLEGTRGVCELRDRPL